MATYPKMNSCRLRVLGTLIGLGGLLAGAAFAAEDQAPKDGAPVAAAAETKTKQAGGSTANFPYAFDDVSGNLVIITCHAPMGDSAGSGFIANMDGKTYIFTNQHVIMGAETIEFVTVKGEQLKPTAVELSARRDIARLKIPDREDALVIGSDAGMGMPLAVFGNSEGAGVATALYGEVTGVGADLLEVSAEFVEGNSGSPVLNGKKEVIGIASYVRFSQPSRMTENTRFENQARRFCYRLNNVRWVAVNWKKYNQDYGVPYREHEAVVTSVFDIISGLFEEPFRTVSVSTSDSELQKWCGDHNRIVGNKGSQMRRDVGSSAEALSSYCQRRARSLEMKLDKRDLTEFLRDEFEGFVYAYGYATEAIDYFGTKLPGFSY